MSEFRGARGSNTGDDFHELWAVRQAIRLLLNEDGLEAITVEGLSASDEADTPAETWDGVDCAQYFGDRTAASAQRIRLEQLKYSAANPKGHWTVARLVEGPRRERSVIGRLARAWKALKDRRPDGLAPEVALVSNQAAHDDLVAAVARAAAGPVAAPKARSKATISDEQKLAHASGLGKVEFQSFAASFRFEAGSGSRFALEEQVLQAIAAWTDSDVQRVVVDLRQFIRNRMRPEFAGELITRESMLLHLGASDIGTLLPCPPDIAHIDRPISREPIRHAADRILNGLQHACLYGGGGVGKTTALQEIEATLPPNSIMVTYDCYGGGRYLDPSAYRHRAADAFLQITNELASRLRLPLLLNRHQGSDYPRLFANRLGHAALALAAQDPGALIVIAIDAADNAVRAAASRAPIEAPFVRDFVLIGNLPANVRFVVTARKGRLDELHLPSIFEKIEIRPFLPDETAQYVRQTWDAPDSWIEDFHHLSGGIPRVQAYALKDGGERPSERIDRLRPSGKTLDEVFRLQFNAALTKTGSQADVSRLCAGLIALARPIPLIDIAGVLEASEAHLRDICTDLAPGIRIDGDRVGFADEDFEHFVRVEGASDLPDVSMKAAAWLLSRAKADAYAALNVAAALVGAGRGADLLELVEQEPSPKAITDPVQRREAEIQRLRLAIKVCREAGDRGRAIRFVLIGAEGVKTEAALLDLLSNNPDLAVRFAAETVGRLIFSDSDLVADQGPLLFQKLSVDAARGDAISVREGRRLLRAWLNERSHRHRDSQDPHREPWRIDAGDIASEIDAASRLQGPRAAIQRLWSWTPRAVRLDVALALAPRMIAEGRAEEIEAVAALDGLKPQWALFLLLPLALAGRTIDVGVLERGLTVLGRSNLELTSFFDSYADGPSTKSKVLDAILTACEILTGKNVAGTVVDAVLEKFLAPELRRVDRRHTHEAIKLDLLLRAHCLRQARSGQRPTSSDLFSPRPEPVDELARRRQRQDTDQHDRGLREFCDTIFDVYRATAVALVTPATGVDLAKSLQDAQGWLAREEWRVSRQFGSGALRAHAAKTAMVVTTVGCRPALLLPHVTAIHGRWRKGYETPNGEFVARLALHQELHAALLDDLAAAANETRAMRIGADEKSKALVSYARLIRPISEMDANAVFNEAIEAASELDQEIVAQIRLLDRLVARGSEEVQAPRPAARRLSNIIADAGIRLEGHDDFPWEEALTALCRLDPSLALANAARWDDEDIARLGRTLPAVLKTALREKTLRPAQASALALILDRDRGVVDQALADLGAAASPAFPALAEEAAQDVLVRWAAHRGDDVTRIIEKANLAGPWAECLLRQERFLDALPKESATRETFHKAPGRARPEDPLAGHAWTREALTDPVVLGHTVDALMERGRAAEVYLYPSRILASAREAVAPRDRQAHIVAVAQLDGRRLFNEVVKSLLESLTEWKANPAIQAWCRSHLPDVIVARFPEFTRYLVHRDDDLSPAIALAGLPDDEVPELILRGLERHVDGLGADLIFALLGSIAGKLTPEAAADLIGWYVLRLDGRIPAEERDQVATDEELPRDVDEAVARTIFAYMGDFDLRLRWRAAHAARRLARLGDVVSLSALARQYERRTEVVFRGGDLAFYWLAARLWYVIAWDRIATESLEAAATSAGKLLAIALDETFPHVLVRAFARDACEKLLAAGRLDATATERDALSLVNQTTLPRRATAKAIKRSFDHSDKGRRFDFDTMDSLPYWYRPILGGFADVDNEKLLLAAEHWIIDVWGYPGKLRALDKERRRNRMPDSEWSLSSNRQGSLPTLERLNNHVEWHAAWCAMGELMKTEPLADPRDHGFDSYDALAARIARNQLTDPPLWASDLRTAVPLQPRLWTVPKETLGTWVLAVGERRHRAELLPVDAPDYVVVDASIEVRTGDRYDETTISSALVQPETAAALLRALQTMQSAWDYKLPSESEDAEIDEAPYRMLGWLRHRERDPALDRKDPFNGASRGIAVHPGQRVMGDCNLGQAGTGPLTWCSPGADAPMFVYESWGEPEADNDRYSSELATSGRRLLAHKAQLLEFLKRQSLDLMVEVEVTRRGREGRRYTGEEEEPNPEARFDRLYALRATGALDIAEGCAGAWTGDCRATEA